MKSLSALLLPAILASGALATPTPDQLVLNDVWNTFSSGPLPELSIPFSAKKQPELKGIADKFLSDAEKFVLKGKKELERWADKGREYIKQDGMMYEVVDHPEMKDYKLRMKEPKLCDSSVKQYSGYLDIADGKSLFFWYFESRSDPDSDPLLLWLNGGPGCSSSTGLLFELGPCNIANEGLNTTFNPYSWNSHANVIFLDQPVNVGFSYSSDGSTVNTSPVSGIDVHAFMELFVKRFKEHRGRPFHIAAESYGGHYAPNIANVIYTRNKAKYGKSGESPAVNLTSVILANGLTDPYVQFGTVADYACEGPFPVFDDPEGAQCQALRTKVPTCQRLLETCGRFGNRFTCVPALLYCNAQLFGPIMQTGKNPYDTRLTCDRSRDGDLCYKELNWVETWMNNPENKVALGVDPERTFASCNMEVNRDFTMQGDGAKNSALLLPELVDNGIRLLVYAGNADMMCNALGNELWVEGLQTQYAKEFSKAKAQPWVTLEERTLAGYVRSAGGKGLTAGNVAFVNVYNAGHMVPHDVPEPALDLITRWIMNLPLAYDD